MRAAIVIGAWIVLAAGSASAAVSVFGNGQAEHCYKAALAGKADTDSIHICDVALANDDLTAPDRGGTLINRGVMRLRRGELSAAEADLQAGVTLNPVVGDGWLDRGAVQVALHRYGPGLADINRAIGLGVTEPEKAYYNRAIAEEGVGDETAAYYDYQQALSLKPGWALPQKELTRFTVTRR
jgi:tetratricopeptide (TPR) repeat protein